MPVPQLKCVPGVIEAGNTLSVLLTNGDYPATLWTGQFTIAPLNGAPLLQAATSSGNGFAVVLSSAQTTTLSTAEYNWGLIVTDTISGQVATAAGGKTLVIPNLASSGTPSQAQQMVTTLQSALASLAATRNKTVSINGQSFTKQDTRQIQEQLTYWQSRVIAEQIIIDRARGCALPGTVAPRFAPAANNNYPFGLFRYGPY